MLQKRSDGFHNIATVFYPVPLKDSLEIVPAPADGQTALYNYGLPVNGAAADNLCVKAWQLLKSDFPELPPVSIHLLKNIPMGAGLGGGSSDGAFMLQLLNNKYQLGIATAQLIAYALQLGSDCPFFIEGKPCYATGRGEIMEPVLVDLSGYQLVLASPGIHVNTGWAFGQLGITGTSAGTAMVREAVLQPVAQWKQLLVNDFEQAVFQQYPQIQALKENLYALGAVYASMSGSGSTVYGLFNKEIKLPTSLPAYHRVIHL